MKIASEKAALDKSSISQFVPRQLLIKVPFFVKNQREINFRPRDVRNLHGQTRAGQIRLQSCIPICPLTKNDGGFMEYAHSLCCVAMVKSTFDSKTFFSWVWCGL